MNSPCRFWVKCKDLRNNIWKKDLLVKRSTYRSSRSQMFFKIGALKDFANVTGKHLCWSLILIKLQAFSPSTLLKRGSQVFSSDICEIFIEHLSLTEHFWWLLVTSTHYMRQSIQEWNKQFLWKKSFKKSEGIWSA